MPFLPQTKVPGDLIRSSDWNAATQEIIRLGQAKLDITGGTISGQLTVDNLTINKSASFGSAVRQMMNLWGTIYGIGVQANTLYFRSGNNFAWYKNGVHDDNDSSPGAGGARLMEVNQSGDLILSARTNPSNSASGSPCRALVDFNQKLIINFAGDFSNGTEIASNLTVDGKVQATSLNFGGTTEILTGQLSRFQIQPVPNFLNVSMGTDPGTNLYTFRIGHISNAVINNIRFTSFVSKLRVDQNGDVHAAGSISPTSADYAEFFESENGKPISQGTSVVIGKKGTIRPAKKGEIPIGIVTKTPGVLGNNPMEWPNQFLTDEYGNRMMENYEEEVPVSAEAAAEWATLTKDGKVPGAKDKKRLLQKVKGTRHKLNPDHDPSKPYVLRSERPEWQIIGLLGQLRMTKGQPVAPGWVKLMDISDKVELWLVK